MRPAVRTILIGRHCESRRVTNQLRPTPTDAAAAAAAAVIRRFFLPPIFSHSRFLVLHTHTHTHTRPVFIFEFFFLDFFRRPRTHWRCWFVLLERFFFLGKHTHTHKIINEPFSSLQRLQKSRETELSKHRIRFSSTRSPCNLFHPRLSLSLSLSLSLYSIPFFLFRSALLIFFFTNVFLVHFFSVFFVWGDGNRFLCVLCLIFAS